MRLYENTNLPELLKNVRLENKLSQEEIAKRIGCTRETVSRIERGTDEPRYAIFYRWLRACGKELIMRHYKKEKIEIEMTKD